ncbi:GumC family protein [Chloroflexota bacterium]
MEDEVDIRKYIDVLLKHWKIMVSITFIAVITTGLVSFLSSPTYEAKSTIILPEEDQKMLITLVKSPHVATQVIERLGNKLEPKEQRLANMLDNVQVRERGNFVDIATKSNDPQKAAAIANVWAESYQNYVSSYYNRVFESSEELQAQANAIRKDYEEKQKAWEEFISDNGSNEINRQIADKELLCDVKYLRDQIKSDILLPTSAAANSLAFILLQASSSTSLPVNLQISTEQLRDLNVSVDEVDALISTLEIRSGGTQGQSVAELSQDINQLKAELEHKNATERELIESKNIAWNAYTSAFSRVIEAKVSAQTRATIIRIAEFAIVPDLPVAPPRVMNISIALILGLLLGVFGAFAVEYFKKTRDKPEKEKQEQEVS